MSNVITIQYTKFTNLDDKGREEDSTFGFRVFDDYATHYNNMFGSMEDVREHINRDNFLEVLQTIEGFQDVEQDTCSGFEFNGEFIEWEEVN